MNLMKDEFRTTRNLVVTALMAAIAVVLGWTHWGFIPWFGGVSLTIIHVPVVIAAIIVGPFSGIIVGFIFGNKGLMFNVTLEGTKITKLDKS